MTIMGAMMPELRTAFAGVSDVLVTDGRSAALAVVAELTGATLAGSPSTRKVQEGVDLALPELWTAG
ncbi:hypothetical protein Q5425_14725 [Amycolatopsis sp. A133]|uniref:hypothetical protein n=1 Tax=Amycolatopsis sp. A133 TaxID=3064472 RepID=UPI0027ECCDA9|nr:hypothetical protein [Amycolatopsis sp. A133]MDQ7804997.1 hypothetical protein [Amycolatopsis sp. A133]